ncbi:MAG: MFS transporter [Promethearchaeota archaeon]
MGLSSVFYNFGVISAIYILFFQYLGFNFTAIGIFEACTSIAIVLTDLPSGSLADMIGRKWTVFIANSFTLLMILLLNLSSGGIITIVIAGILSGLEFSFKSGAKSALLFDTMKELEREDEFLKISGRINAFSLISNLLGMPLGSFLFVIRPQLPYWVWFITISLSLLIIAMIREPFKSSQKYNFRILTRNMKKSLQYIFRNKQLLWLAFFFLIANVFAESYWDVFSQAHLKLVDIIPSIIGIIFTIIVGISAFASYFVSKIEQKLGTTGSLYLIILFQGGLFFIIAFMNIWYLLVIFLILFSINTEFALLLEESYSNKLISSLERASVLSAISFLHNGLFGGAVIIWLFGLSIDMYGGFSTMISSGALVLIVGLLLLQIRKSI